MKKKSIFLCCALALAVIIASVSDSTAYQRYKNTGVANTWCAQCHGDFTSGISPKGTVFPSNNKHTMHRSSSYMAANCSLCHSSGDSRNPFIGSSDGTTNNPGLGCIGCHEGRGLRAHHAAMGVTSCFGCHVNEAGPPESTKPPYYGTADTRVNNPCNPVAQANINENWSVGDFIGLDNDGDNLYDTADPDCAAPVSYYCDKDNDTYFNTTMDGTCSGAGCPPPGCRTTPGTDCNDANPAINPGATEICDGIDNNCNNLIDDADPGVVGRMTWYADADGDMYGNPGMSLLACNQPVGYVANNTDCDDANPAVNPGATEICDDGVDNDCNGLIDANDPVCGAITYYCDKDMDMYFNTAMDGTCIGTGCEPQGCTTTPGTDCDDANAAINPGASEVCDGVDNNCNGLIDDADPGVVGRMTWYADADGDMYGNPGMMTLACNQPAGYVADNTDCDDANAAINPGATELCSDGLDNDCNNLIDANDPACAGAAHSYYFPAIKDNDSIGWANYLTVQAKDPVSMDVTIRVYSMSGALLGTYIYSDTDPNADAPAIAPYARVAQRPSIIAGSLTAPVPVEGSMTVETNVPAIATTNTIANFFEGFGINESAKPKSVHSFPKQYDGPNNYQVYLLIQNSYDTARNVTITYFGKTSSAPGHGATLTTTIEPFGSLKIRPSDIAGGINLDGSSVVYSNLSSPGDGMGLPIPAMCRYEIGMEAMSLYESTVSQPSSLHFPILKDGKFGGAIDFQNYISVVNPSTTEATITITIYNNSGIAEGSVVNEVVPALGKKTWRPSMIKGTITSPIDFIGSAVIRTDIPLVGQTNTIYPGANVYGIDAFDLFESALPDSVMFFPKAFDNLTGEGHLYDNFVHVQNPDNLAKKITIEQFNNDGVPNGTRTIDLAANATYVYRPKDIVTDGTGSFRGSVRVTENGGLRITGAIKYEIHSGTTAATPVDAMTLYRSMGL